MTDKEFAAEMLTHLPYTPNKQQMSVALALARFCEPSLRDSAERVFILNGYAGTGKTSLIGSLVKTLQAHKIPTQLMAPTGRAAKVFSANAGCQAYTLHRKLYRHVLPGQVGAPVAQANSTEGGIFIVDEASMIGTDGNEGASNLLTDLIYYVYSSHGCRLILLGDTAQLPPVGQTESPAMSTEVMHSYGLKVTKVTLTQIARQAAMSGILFNATRVRRALGAEFPSAIGDVPLAVSQFGDVDVVESDEIVDLLSSLYSATSPEDTIVVTRSNLSATQFNQGIRSMVLGYEEQLCPDDMLIAAKNNYYWTRKVKGLDFIANGEILRLSRIIGHEIRYGLSFADAEFEIPDRPGISFTAKILLDALSSAAPALDPDDTRKLWQGVYNDPELMGVDTPHEQRLKIMRESPYFNALQVKYAYAVTCHKAQGGQWKNVLVDLSYIPADREGSEFFRWLYTAITRARTNLYLINPPEQLVQ